MRSYHPPLEACKDDYPCLSFYSSGTRDATSSSSGLTRGEATTNSTSLTGSQTADESATLPIAADASGGEPGGEKPQMASKTSNAPTPAPRKNVSFVDEVKPPASD